MYYEDFFRPVNIFSFSRYIESVMPRPKFAPGSFFAFTTKNRSGKKALVPYLASRLGVVDDWARDLVLPVT